MRYVVNLQGTVWRRQDNGARVIVVFDPAHMGGNIQRTLFVQQTGNSAPADKPSTPKRLMHNCTPVNGTARAAYTAITLAEGTTTDSAALPQGIHYSANFTGSHWRKTDNGKLVVVIADPSSAGGHPMRKLWVSVVTGDHAGKQHASSPHRLHTAYAPACDLAARISNGDRAA